jgi:hypothetical protein
MTGKMDRASIYKLLLALSLFTLGFTLFYPRAEAHSNAQRYDLTICEIAFPDGTTHRAGMCWAPSTNGPCDRASECMNGTEPPRYE